MMPDNLIRLWVFELVGVDLMQVGGNTYLVQVDKKAGYRMCEFLKRTTMEDVTRCVRR